MNKQSDPISQEKFELIHKQAVTALGELLDGYDKLHGNEEEEVIFMGNLFANMIIATYLGYYPEKLGREAEEAAIRLMKEAGVSLEEVEQDGQD